ncbi:MAG: hypothetical protein PHC61_16975, partial [Chitinivibrionales bacterium]|nr:hypothetical protein [Chitinivibrionales bacterium]
LATLSGGGTFNYQHFWIFVGVLAVVVSVFFVVLFKDETRGSSQSADEDRGKEKFGEPAARGSMPKTEELPCLP